MDYKLFLIWFFTSLLFISFGCGIEKPSARGPLLSEPSTENITPYVAASWEAEWENTLAKAKKEGKVVMYTSSVTPATRKNIADAFMKKFNISIENVIGAGGDARISAERRSGLFYTDVFIGGSATLISIIKPEGHLDPLLPMFILPEIKDQNKWWQSELPFIDKERKYVLAFTANRLADFIVINTNVIKPGELTSYNDLLQAKWKGKIALFDPTIPGRGSAWFAARVYTKSPDFEILKKLAGQDVFLSRDHRQLMDWASQGKYPIAIAINAAIINESREAGAPIEEIALKEDIPVIASGTGTLGLFKNPPHPNSSRVFINWLLSKEGQTIWSRWEVGHSVRMDVPTDHLPPNRVRRPEEKLFITENEEYLVWRGAEATKIAREVFSIR